MNSRQSRWDKIKLGCQIEWFDGRIDVLMNVPSPEAARDKLYRNLQTALQERFHNYQTFVLPPRPNLYGDDDEEEGNGNNDGNGDGNRNRDENMDLGSNT